MLETRARAAARGASACGPSVDGAPERFVGGARRSDRWVGRWSDRWMGRRSDRLVGRRSDRWVVGRAGAIGGGALERIGGCGAGDRWVGRCACAWDSGVDSAGACWRLRSGVGDQWTDERGTLTPKYGGQRPTLPGQGTGEPVEPAEPAEPAEPGRAPVTGKTFPGNRLASGHDAAAGSAVVGRASRPQPETVHVPVPAVRGDAAGAERAHADRARG